MLRSLDNYFLDWIKSPANRLTAQLPESGELAASPDDEVDAFEVAWARQVLDEVLQDMKADCEAHDQLAIWGVFECRLLAPARQNVAPVSYEMLCKQFDLESPEQASNALVTAKRKFERAFARIATRYQHDDEQSNDLLQELTDVLSRVGPLDWHTIPEACGAAADGVSAAAADLGSSHPGLLARLFAKPSDADALWQPEDLVGLIRHQLGQRLADLDLRISPEALDALTEGATDRPLLTLADLYAHPKPPLELLEAVKRYGRKRVHRAEQGLPNEIASALYFASIATALVCHGQRITTSDNELLGHGFSRLLERPWIEPPLRGLFEESLASLRRSVLGP